MDDLATWRTQLKHSDAAIRAAAAENLCLAGPEAAEAAVDLVRACGDQEDVQNWAVAALESLGPPPHAALQALSVLAANDHRLVAYWAVTLLGRLEATAQPAVDDLAQVLSQSPYPELQQRIAWALGKIGGTTAAAQAALKRARASADPRLASLATSALSSHNQEQTLG